MHSCYGTSTIDVDLLCCSLSNNSDWILSVEQIKQFLVRN